MQPRALLRIHAFVATAYAVWLVLHPSSLLAMYGVDGNAFAEDVTRQLGAVFLSFGCICWMARDATPGPALDAIVRGIAIGLTVGFLASIASQTSGRVGPMHWSAVATWLLLALGYWWCVLGGETRRGTVETAAR
jgi:hypothetical protein